jgi:threonine aldolase
MNRFAQTTVARRGFASDNNAGIHPEILQAIAAANRGHTIAYGDDPYTRSAVEAFKALLGDEIEVFFVYNGTAANVLGLASVLRPFNAVICSDCSHIQIDECGAPEKFTGCKLLPVAAPDGKVRVSEAEKHLHLMGFEHHVQPKAISITQATELGTVYRPEEIREIADFAHGHGMVLHMDGARIANAAVCLDVDLRRITGDAGVDVLSFGGTKNGAMFGEAVVFFDPALAADFRYIRKQGMQLASKMRFVAAQFHALLSGDLWLRNARHANRMARLLAAETGKIPGIRITQKVEANGVFATVHPGVIPTLQKESFFYVWNPQTSEVRWMTAFDTTEEDVHRFVDLLRRVIERAEAFPPPLP